MRAIVKMLARSCAKGADPLFSFESDSKLISLSSLRFHSLLHSTLRHAGLSTTNISAHSFHRGAASYAAFLGISAEQLKSQGNWKSECYRRYVTLDAVNRQQFSASMSSAVSDLWDEV